VTFSAGTQPAQAADSPVVKLLQSIDERQRALAEAAAAPPQRRSWWQGFWCSVRPTDALIAMLALCFVGLGGWQAYQLKRGADLAREDSRRRMRAYVSADLAGEILNAFSPGLPAFQIRMINSGQTPAYDVRSWRAIAIHELPLGAELARPADAVEESDAVIGAGGEAFLALHWQGALGKEQLADIKAGTRGLYVFGCIEYLDVFGDRHHTQFCLYQALGNGARMKRAAHGNAAT
jgi:hypothetical protein